MSRVTNGASLRHKRVMDMLLFIKAQDGEKTQIRPMLKSSRSQQNSGRGEVAWLAHRPVEPGARVQIPASALTSLLPS
jgi:hypothetical protein